MSDSIDLPNGGIEHGWEKVHEAGLKMLYHDRDLNYAQCQWRYANGLLTWSIPTLLM
ncbi:MAG: hypothetical protein U5K54_23900 [Cytophagales bacterium]|nr:hypothetical protein [Cytophagales bacterium]